MTPTEIVKAWVDAFNRIDIDALAELYHPDAINHQVNTEPVHGREVIRKMFEEEFSKAEMVCIVENIFEDRGRCSNGKIRLDFGVAAFFKQGTIRSFSNAGTGTS